MYWQKSCACCKNWKSSLHVSIWLVLIRFLKIIRCRLPELSIYKGRLKSKKQHAQPIFLAEPLIPTAAPSSLPWERARERATSRKACIEVVRGLGKIAEIRGMPSPQPSPTEEGAGCSGFRRCRPSEKECPKYQRQEFFRQPLSQGRWNKRRERFFRRPLNPSVGCVPQGTHAVGWGCRENGERVRALRHTPYMRATACLPQQREFLDFIVRKITYE